MEASNKRSRSSASNEPVNSGEQEVFPLAGLENLKESVWLVKIPPYICEQWANAKQDEILGSFHVAKTSDGKRQFVVKLDNDKLTSSSSTSGNAGTNKRGLGMSSAGVSSAIPKDLVIAEVQRPKGAEQESMIAVASADKKNFHVESRITKRFVMRPQNRSELAAIMKERTLSNIANKDTIEVKEVDEATRAANNAKTIALSTHEMTKINRIRGNNSLTAEMETEIRRCILPLLQRDGFVKLEPLWESCKSIENVSKDMLKEVLKDIATYNSSGPNKFFYELIDEYRDISP